MAIRPHFSKFDFHSQQWIFGLDHDDFIKIQQGYGCGRCLEDYNGIWRPKCPVCGCENETVVDTPPEWR